MEEKTACADGSCSLHCHGNTSASSISPLPAKGELQPLRRQHEPRRSPSPSKTPFPQATALSAMSAKTFTLLQRVCLAAAALFMQKPHNSQALRCPGSIRASSIPPAVGVVAPLGMQKSPDVTFLQACILIFAPLRGLMSPELSFQVPFTGFPQKIFCFLQTSTDEEVQARALVNAPVAHSPSPSRNSLKKTPTSTWVLTGECGLWC